MIKGNGRQPATLSHAVAMVVHAMLSGMKPLAALLILLLAWPAPGRAGPLRDGYQASYSVTRNGLPLGESIRTVRRTADGSWQATARTAPTGLVALLFSDVIEEHSRLHLTEQGAQPLHYRYRRYGGRKEQDYQLRFDWTTGRLHLSHSGKDIPLPPGTQDPLSFVVQVMHRLEQGERAFAMTIAGRKKTRDYAVRVLAEVPRPTPLGRQPVLQVQADEVGKDTRYDLWLLPRHDHVPLRIRQHRGDETIDLKLLTLVSPPPAGDPGD